MLIWLETAIYAAILIIMVLCCLKSSDEKLWEWNILLFTTIFTSEISMTFISIVSVRHIHNQSKAIERIGIKTDSKLMKLYAFGWIGLNLFELILLALVIFIFYVADNLRLIIVYEITFMVFFVFLVIHNLLIVLAYYRMSRKLSNRTKNLVASTLRAGS